MSDTWRRPAVRHYSQPSVDSLFDVRGEVKPLSPAAAMRGGEINIAKGG